MAFSRILGHERQIEVLQRNIKSGQIPPAYLFHGDEGIGKHMAAIEFAKSVNCGGDLFGDVPCDTCQNCRNIEAGCHPNVSALALEMNQDTGKMRQEIVIKQVRAAQDFLSLKAVGEGRKVLIVDGAHLMNEESANAFLKTLEEPPDNSHVILITSRAASLLPTILSRCRAVSFQPLKEDLVAGLLMERGMPPDDARIIARMTGGRVGDALSSDAGELRESRKAFLKTLDAITKKGPSAVLKAAEEVVKEAEGLPEFVFFGSMWFRDILVILVGGDARTAYNEDMLDSLYGWAGRTTPARCENALLLLKQAGRSLERTFNRRLLAEDLFFRLREEASA
jgi:DNA polymerase-3 subunit delta'